MKREVLTLLCILLVVVCPSEVMAQKVAVANLVSGELAIPEDVAWHWIKKAAGQEVEGKRASRDFIKKVAEDFGLLERPKVNPRLRLLSGDLSSFYEQAFTEEEIVVEFASRRMVLDSAAREDKKIDSKGDLSHAAEALVSNIEELIQRYKEKGTQ